MIIVFTTKGTTWDSAMDPRFGRTEYFVIYDEQKDELISFDNRASENDAHGAGPKTAQKLFKFNPDVLITGNGLGGNAETVVKKSNIKVFVGAGEMTVKEAFEAYKNNSLKES